MPAILIIEDEAILAKNVRTYLQRQGYEARVAPSAEAGLTALESLGAHAAVAIARVMVRAHRRLAQTGPDDFKLSSRQWQVAELLVAQCTDREIADALVITPKTAGHHVSAILTKLGVGSRREAAEVARGLGLSAAART